MSLMKRGGKSNLIHNAIYRFPILPTSRNPDRATRCPKCDTPLTDNWHGIWVCGHVQDYWDLVQNFVSSHWRVTLDKTPESLLFHYIRPPRYR